MKRLLLVLLTVCTQAHAQTRFDGNWWNGSEDIARGSFLLGYKQGMVLVAEVAPMVICNAQKHTDEAFRQCIYSGTNAMNEEFVTPTAGKTYRQLIDGVSEFYRDYKNRGICFEPALSFVTQEINGMSRNLRDSKLQTLRREPTTGFCN
jgi:hypothetical protein